MKDRDAVILQKIIRYTDEIAYTMQEYDLTLETLKNSITPKNAISMCILQIGELVGLLSEEIKQQYGAIPWSRIKAMRNIVAHNYEVFDMTLLWETANHDIPHLKSYCEKILVSSSDTVME